MNDVTPPAHLYVTILGSASATPTAVSMRASAMMLIAIERGERLVRSAHAMPRSLEAQTQILRVDEHQTPPNYNCYSMFDNHLAIPNHSNPDYCIAFQSTALIAKPASAAAAAAKLFDTNWASVHPSMMSTGAQKRGYIAAEDQHPATSCAAERHLLMTCSDSWWKVASNNAASMPVPPGHPLGEAPPGLLLR